MQNMKQLLTLLVLLFPSMLFSQHAEIFSIDTTNYPIISAKMMILDKESKLVKNLKVANCEIFENGNTAQVTKVENPKSSNTKFSILFAVDVSGSMSGQNLELAKGAMKAFVKSTPFSNTEIAISTFDTDSYVNQDFTRNSLKITKAINAIQASGGTDYNAGLISKTNSALNLAKRRKGREPVIIFLTDGLSSAGYEKITQQANAIGAKVYVITLNMPVPHDLAEISENTNARYFENINTVEDAKKSYLSILLEVMKLNSTIFWKAEKACSEIVNVRLVAKKKYKCENMYSVEQTRTKGVFFSSKVITFDPLVPKKKTKFTIQANTETTITQLTVKDTSIFDIKYSFKLPYRIKPGKKLTVRVIMKKEEAKPVFTELILESDICPPKIGYIYSGNIADFIIPGSLVVLEPNGGDVFYGGVDTEIKWKNKTKVKDVNLLFSSDNGKSYQWIGSSTAKSKFWLVPGVQSDSCIVKVALKTEPKLLRTTNNTTTQTSMEEDGSTYITCSGKKLFVHSTTSGKVLQKVKFSEKIMNFKLADNSRKIIIRTEKNKLWVYNTSTEKKKKIKVKADKILDYFPYQKTKSNTIPYSHSEDFKKYDKKNGEVIVFYQNQEAFYQYSQRRGWRVNKSKLGASVKKVSKKENLLSIITLDNRWVIWDIDKKGSLFQFPSEEKELFLSSDINFDTTYAAVLSTKNKIIYWSRTLADTVLTVPYKVTNKKYDLLFNPKNNSLLCNKEGKALTLLLGKEILYKYKTPKNKKITTTYFTPTGDALLYGIKKEYLKNGHNSETSYTQKYNLFTKKLASKKSQIYFDDDLLSISTNKRGNSGIFREEDRYSVYQLPSFGVTANDVSDSVFSIYVLAPNIKKSIEMRDVFVSSTSATVDTSVFYNPHEHQAIVNSIFFSGKHADKFRIISGIPPVGVFPKKNKGIEISFSGAKEPGEYEVVLCAVAGKDTLCSKVSINAIPLPVESMNEDFDIGTVNLNKQLSSSISVFKNISKKKIEIDSIVNWGPDKEQLILTNRDENRIIKPGKSMKFNFDFVGKSRGMTDAVFKIYLKGMPEPLKLHVSGNVYAVYEIDVRVEVTNKIPTRTGEAVISCFDAGTENLINSFNTDANGKQNIQLANELKYNITANFPTADTVFLDLSNAFSDTTIIVNISILEYRNNDKYPVVNNNFTSGNALLTSKMKEELGKLAFLLTSNPEIKILITGHADNSGDEEKNLKISEDRAKNVQEFLLSKDVNIEQITLKGAGASHPLNSNKTDAEKAKNRRFEIKLIKD